MATATILKPAKPFRWLGQHGPANDRKGVLHIRWTDGATVRVISPGEIVKKSENLEALGAARVDEFVKDGFAEYVSALEKLDIGEVTRVESDQTPEEKQKAEQIAQDAATNAANLQAMANRGKQMGLDKDNRLADKSNIQAGIQTTEDTPPAIDLDVLSPGAGPSGGQS